MAVLLLTDTVVLKSTSFSLGYKYSRFTHLSFGTLVLAPFEARNCVDTSLRFLGLCLIAPINHLVARCQYGNVSRTLFFTPSISQR